MFDSGVGGLTVLSALTESLPAEDFIYLGDTARLPYGTKSPDTVRAYACHASQLLVDRGIKALVVACNTASAFALDALRAQFPHIPVFGVVEPGADAVADVAGSDGVLILATESTISGGAYQRSLLARLPSVKVYGRSCPLWVTLAEMPTRAPELVRSVLDHELRGFLHHNSPKTVLLGCTHFPVFREQILARYAEAGLDVTVVDSASTTARALRTVLDAQDLSRQSEPDAASGSCTFLGTDGVGRFVSVGRQFFGPGLDLSRVEIVDLS